MVLVKNVNPQQPDNQALRDEPANPNPPDIHPPPADRDDPEKIDWIEACLLTTVAMAAVLMFSLIISDCLLGVDLPLFMSSSVEGLGSYSFQVFQSTHLILLDTIAACLSLLQSAWAMLSVSKWPHLFWSTIRNMLTSLKSASVTLWRDYLPIVKNGVIALATSLDRWATQYFGPFFGEFLSYLQSTVNKLLDSDTSTKQPQPGFFDLAVLFVTFLATIPLAYMTITNLVFIIHKVWRLITFFSFLLSLTVMARMIKHFFQFLFQIIKRLLMVLISVFAWLILLVVCIFIIKYFLTGK